MKEQQRSHVSDPGNEEEKEVKQVMIIVFVDSIQNQPC